MRARSSVGNVWTIPPIAVQSLTSLFVKSVSHACVFAWTAAPASSTTFCKSAGSVSSHGLLTTAIEMMNVSLVTVTTLRRSFILNDTNTESPEMVPSMVPWSSAGTTSESGMPIPVAPSFAIFCRSSSVPLMRSFLPLKSESRRIGFFCAVIGRAQVQRRDADHPFRRSQLEHRRLHGAIVDRRRGVRFVAEQHWRREHAETRIDAD